MPAAVPFINSSNARALALLSWANRKAKAAAKPPPCSPVLPAVVPAEEYVSKQLLRTRKQIDLLNDRLDDPGLDWKAVKAIADAKARLYDIEAALANRPKPGMLRPVAQRAGKRNYASQGPPANWDTPVPVQSQFAPSTNATTQVDASNHAQHTAAPLPEACADYCI